MVALFFRTYVEKPKLCFGLTLGAHVSLLIVTAALYAWGFDILPADFTQVPLNLEEDSTKLRADAWKYVRQNSRVSLNPSMVGIQSERVVRYDILELIYESKGGNVFSRENLLHIEKTESELFNNSIYQAKLCQLIKGIGCRKPMSILRFFDGTYKKLNPVFYDPHFENIVKVLYVANSLNYTKPVLDFHLGKNAVLDFNKHEATSHYTRSFLYIGYPLKGYSNIEDSPDEQISKIEEHAKEAFAKTLDDKYKDGLGSMNVYYFLRALFFQAISKQVIFDLLLAGASFTFIFLFMLFQTQSLWITGWAVFSILTCFFGANLIYRLVLDCRYIGIFHVLSVFMILGIGADDVFVFVDTWKASESKRFEDLAARLSFVYRRAARAMLTTSFTTIVAFVTSVFSPLLGVSTFGIFSALLVFVNYCSVILFFPSVIITYELFWKDWQWGCSDRPSPVESRGGQDDTIQSQEQEATEVGRDSGALEPTKIIISFFDTYFYDKVVTHCVIRWVILAAFFIFLCASVGFATRLEPDQEAVEVWGTGTNWHSIKHLRRNAFKPSHEDKVIEVNIIWGLGEQDRSSCHFTDYKCRGRTVFDQDFNLNHPQCQVALLEFCREIKNLPDDHLDTLRIRRHAVTGIPEVHCFMESLDNFLREEGTKPIYNETVVSLPTSKDKIQLMMQHNPRLFNMSLVSNLYDRYFEVTLGYWLTKGNTSFNSQDYYTYGRLLGGELDPTDSTGNPNYQGGKYGNRLLFASVLVNTTIVLAKTGYKEGLKVHDHWEKFVSERVKTMPVECRNAFQATPEGYNAWHWMKVKKVLSATAVRGILLSLGLAIATLILITSNWIVGLMCGGIIAGITVGVVGIIPLAGWKLGVLESLNLTLVVGLAVDYVVHLADGYVQSRHHLRQDKLRDMLGHVGVSVLSGASTTLGASVFMLAAKILFFFQFGIFMFSTIGLSVLYALFLFPTLLGLFGPEGDRGSFSFFTTYCCRGQRDVRKVEEEVEFDELSPESHVDSPCPKRSHSAPQL